MNKNLFAPAMAQNEHRTNYQFIRKLWLFYSYFIIKIIPQENLRILTRKMLQHSICVTISDIPNMFLHLINRSWYSLNSPFQKYVKARSKNLFSSFSKSTEKIHIL